jgi:hypothetical protein
MDPAVEELVARIDAFDVELFDPVEAQLPNADRRALLALHAAVAASRGSFAYLEIGSYRGGSLQAVMQDPRCSCVMSIDPRTTVTPDTRGTYTYEDNTTARMRQLLSSLPAVDMDKLTTFDLTTDGIKQRDLPCRPAYCFVDGQHTHDAVIRDGRFCIEALNGQGVIAFHDSNIVEAGIRRFVKENWGAISHAMALPGSIFAVELGREGILREDAIERLLDSSWHRVAWALASRPKASPLAVFAAWKAMPRIDSLIFALKARLRTRRQQ